MTTTHQYNVDKYDDIGGLDSLSLSLPALSPDVVERCTWDVVFGDPRAYDIDPERYGMDDDKVPFVFIDPDDVIETTIPDSAIRKVRLDVLETLIEEHQPQCDTPDDGDVSHLATLKTTWRDFEGEWRLVRYSFEDV